jgi:hypothetical protein
MEELAGNSTRQSEPFEEAGKVLYRFWQPYSVVHGYMSIMVCLFGIPMNLINIAVLSR